MRSPVAAMACLVAPTVKSADSCSPTAKSCRQAISPCRSTATAFPRASSVKLLYPPGSDSIVKPASAGGPIALFRRVRTQLLSLLGR